MFKELKKSEIDYKLNRKYQQRSSLSKLKSSGIEKCNQDKNIHYMDSTADCR
jgi:hypothetical protein